MKKIIKPVVIAMAAWLALWGTDFVFKAANVIRNNNLYKTQTPYKNQQELDVAFEKEKKVLGIDNLQIKLEIDNSINYAYCTKYKDNSYDLRFCPENMCPFFLRHELFHIKRIGENKLSNRKYCMPFKSNYEEWLATSYAIKRAKEEAE